jgi:hypothetical protein
MAMARGSCDPATLPELHDLLEGLHRDASLLVDLVVRLQGWSESIDRLDARPGPAEGVDVA